MLSALDVENANEEEEVQIDEKRESQVSLGELCKELEDKENQDGMGETDDQLMFSIRGKIEEQKKQQKKEKAQKHDVLHFEELQYLLEDRPFFEKLQKAQLRVDQVLNVFQKLDIASTNEVGIAEFVEGLLRLKQRVQGIDVAAGKSWMRRLVLESHNLDYTASTMQQTTLAIVEQLRGVQVLEPEVEEQDAERPADKQRATKVEEQQLLEKANVRLQKKIAKVKAEVARRRAKLARLHHQDALLACDSSRTGAD